MIDGVVPYGAMFAVLVTLTLLQVVTAHRPPAIAIRGLPPIALMIALGVQQHRMKVSVSGRSGLLYRVARPYVSLSVPAAAFALCVMSGPHMLVAFFPYAAASAVVAFLGVLLLRRASVRLRET